MQEGDVESTGIGGGCVPIWLVFFTYRGILDSFSGFMYRLEKRCLPNSRKSQNKATPLMTRNSMLVFAALRLRFVTTPDALSERSAFQARRCA